MVELLIYNTGMCIKGPESWWIAKSITISRVVNQSKVNPQSQLILYGANWKIGTKLPTKVILLVF